ncbi:hypothetical protein RQP46_007187 [Phenoliferia psychrophenolica]
MENLTFSIIHISTSDLIPQGSGWLLLITHLATVNAARSTLTHVLISLPTTNEKSWRLEIQLVEASKAEDPAVYRQLLRDVETRVGELVRSHLRPSMPFHAGLRVTGLEISPNQISPDPWEDWLATGVLVKWIRPLADLGPAASKVPFVTTADLELTDGKVSGSSMLVSFVKWRGEVVVLKSLGPTDGCFHDVDTPGEQEVTKNLVNGFYNELAVITSLPPHPSIMSAPLALVSTSSTGGSDDNPSIFGFIVSLHSGGTLQDRITSAPPPLRISYCLQLAQALNHLHHVGHTFHGDLKFDNMLFSTTSPYEPLILIDFEQGRTNPVAAAPELLGGWDVTASSAGALVYTKYDGPPRKYGGPSYPSTPDSWMPFRSWAQYPEAIERAEVFAFGKCASDILHGRHDPQYYWEEYRDEFLNTAPRLEHPSPPL